MFNKSYQEMPESPKNYKQPYVISPTAPQGDSSFNSIVPQPNPMHSVRAPLGPRSCLYTCHNCQQQQMTKIVYETSQHTHLIATLLCIVGCICCVCCPYYINSCKNTNHYCSNCDTYLGTYSK